MNRGYSDKTHELILRMERANLANPQPWDKENVLIALCKSYKAADIEFPKKVVVCMNLTDKRFLGAARAAGAAGVVGVVWADGVAWAVGVAWVAWAGWAVGAAGVAWAAWAAGADSDYDFNELVFLHEFLQENKGNEND